MVKFSSLQHQKSTGELSNPENNPVRNDLFSMDQQTGYASLFGCIIVVKIN
jgi:hypothetical protein